MQIASAITSLTFSLICLGWRLRQRQIFLYVRQKSDIKEEELVYLRKKVNEINTHIRISTAICVIFMLLTLLFGGI